MQNGVYMFRCNFSHMTYPDYIRIHRQVTQLNRELGTQVLIQADLQGHRIRLGLLPKKGILLEARRVYHLVPEGPKLAYNYLPVDDPELFDYVEVGQPITFANGLVEAEVTKISGTKVSVKTCNSGHIYSHKGINLPAGYLRGGLTDKDRRDIQFLLATCVDWIAISFVSDAGDVTEVRELLGGEPIRLMSKIERRTAIKNLAAIAAASDAIMVARGDLGIELPYEEIPAVQKQIIEVSHRYRIPAIVASQVLFSLVHGQSPTRPEVADIAAAVTQHADGLLLADETAMGINPVNALNVLKRITAYSEKSVTSRPDYFK